MKKLFTLILLGALLALFTAPADAEVGAPQSFGITNAALAASAGATALGQSEVRVEGQDNVLLIATGTSIVTNATASWQCTIARVDGSGNVETSPRLTWIHPFYSVGADSGVTVTNSFVLVTNLPASYLGAARGLALISVTNLNNAGGTITSPALKVQKKTIKAAP